MNSHHEEIYKFHRKELWTGRFPNILSSTDANLKLLRVILLTKGSSMTQFATFVGSKLGKTLLGKEGEKKFTELLAAFQDEEKGKAWLANELTDFLGLPEFPGSPQILAFINNKPLSSVTQSFGGKGSNKTSPLDNAKTAFLEKQTSLLKLIGQSDPDFEVQQLRNLRTLCHSLKNFVEGSLKGSVDNFFANNKGNDRDLHVIRECFQHVANDAEIIQRAIVQRVHEIDDNLNYVMSTQARALEIMDKLALKALAPFEHLLPNQAEIVPITYFSEHTHVHRVPYCDNVLLIGVRYDQVLQEIEGDGGQDEPPPPFELLAIPHEVGHYVYPNARISYKRCQATFNSLNAGDFGEDNGQWANHPFLTNRSNWEFDPSAKEIPPDAETTFMDLVEMLPVDRRYKEWCEEIFADTCGCIVAGPLTALSMQSLLASSADKANHDHDGEHPPGILRPFILSEILDVLQTIDQNHFNFGEAGSELRGNWRSILRDSFGHSVENDESKGMTVTVKNAPADPNVANISEALKAIRPIIHLFAQFLLSQEPHTAWNQQKGAGDQRMLEKYYDDAMVSIGTQQFIKDIVSGRELTGNATGDKTPIPNPIPIAELAQKWDDKGPVNSSVGT